MTNKEKMISLMKACLNDKRFYNEYFRKEGDEKVSLNYGGYSYYEDRIPTQKNIQYWFQQIKYNGHEVYQSLSDKYNLPMPVYKNTEEKYWQNLIITFTNSPSLKLMLNRTNNEKIIKEYSFKVRPWIFLETKSFKNFFKFKFNEKIDFTLVENTPEFYYELSHGTIREFVTIEAAFELFELRDKMENEIQLTIDSEKLDKRIQTYVK